MGSQRDERDGVDGVDGGGVVVESNLTAEYETRETNWHVRLDDDDTYRYQKVRGVEYRFPVGGIEELPGIDIEVDYMVDLDRDNSGNTCPHMSGGVVPLVVHVMNEGGHRNTTACVQCIMEAVERLRRDGVIT